MKKTLVVFILSFTFFQVVQAQPPVSFSAYAGNPVSTPDSLLKHWRQATTATGRFNAAMALVRFHEASGAADSMLFYARSIQQEAAENKRSEKEKLQQSAAVVNAMAKACQAQGLYEEALRYYLQGIGLGEKLNDISIINQNKFGQASVYFFRNEFDKAVPLYNAVQQAAADSNLVQLVNKQLGIIYLARRDLATATPYFNKAAAYFQQNRQLKNELEVRLNLAFIMELEHKLDTAYTAFASIKDVAQQHQFYDLYIKAGQHIGDILVAKKDYENARMALSMVYMNAVQWEDLEAQRRAITSLQNIYVAQGDYKNAYALMTQYVGVMNDIASKQNKREVAELEIKYNTAQREKEILQKENQLQHQRTVKYGLLIGFIIVLLPVIGLLYLYYQKLQTQSRLNVAMEETNRQQIRTMLKEKELEVLKAAVEGEEKERGRISKELHDSIGGNLAAIKMQLAGQSHNNQEAILQQLDTTYEQVRGLSHTLAPKSFSNTGFIELLQTYLQRFHREGVQNVHFKAYPEEAVNSLSTPLKVELYKIIQELMTNAQKHAQASVVDVQLTCVEDALKLIFDDNGKGFDTEKLAAGIGLQNIKERLQQLNGTLAIDAFPGRGTVIDIELPLNT